jgi:regulator of protease activity HflC (stomatin/prohibitin superfamily)
MFENFNGPTIDGKNGRPVVNLDAQLERSKKLLKLVGILLASIVAIFIFFNYIASITRIGAGYVGVEVVLSGSQRGASEIPIRTGWVFYSPLRSQIIEFPTFVQTVKWTANLSEGRAQNEEMSFNTKEGMEIYADVSLSYAIEQNRAPDFYVKYRISDLDNFTHGILRDIVRNSLNEVASTYSVEQIYGEQKAEFLNKVQALIQSKMNPVGIAIQQFGFIGAPRVPPVIAAAITGKAQAIQAAEQARNELAKTQAEAAKTVAAAEGEAKAAVTRAQGEAEANKIRQASLTPQLLELRKIENQKALIDRWNGALPTVQTGNGGLLMELPKMQQ